MISEFDLSSPPLASLNIQNYLFLDDDKEAECILSALGEETDSFTSGSVGSLRYRVEFKGGEVSITSIEAEPQYIWHKNMSSEEAATMYRILRRGVVPDVLMDIVPDLEVSGLWPVLLVKKGQPDVEVDVLAHLPPEPINKSRSKSRGKEVCNGKNAGKSNGRTGGKISPPASSPATTSSSQRTSPPHTLPSPTCIPSEYDFLDGSSSSLRMFNIEDWCSEDAFQHMSGLLSPAPQQVQKKSSGRPRASAQSKDKIKAAAAPPVELVPLQNDLETDLPDFADDWFDFSGTDFADYDTSPSKNASSYSAAFEGMDAALDPTPQRQSHPKAPVVSIESELAAFAAKNLPVTRVAAPSEQRKRIQHILTGIREHRKYIKEMYEEHYFISEEYGTAVAANQRIILPLQLINLKVAPPASINPYRLCSPETYMKSFERLSYYDYSMSRWIDKPSALLMGLARPEIEQWKSQNKNVSQGGGASQHPPKIPRKKSQVVDPDDPAPKRKKYTKKTSANDKAEAPGPRSGNGGPSGPINGMRNAAPPSTVTKTEIPSVPHTQQPYYPHHLQQPVAFQDAHRMGGAAVPLPGRDGGIYDTLLNQTQLRQQHLPHDSINTTTSYLHERQLTEAKHEFSLIDQPGKMLLPGLRKDVMPVPPAPSRGGSKKPTDGESKRKGSRQGTAQAPSAATVLAQKLKAQEQDRLIEAAAEKVLSMNSSAAKSFDPSSLLPAGGGHLQGLLSSGMTPRLQQHAFPLTQNTMAFQPATVYPYNYQQPPVLPPSVKKAVNTIANSNITMGSTPESQLQNKVTISPDSSFVIPPQSRPLGVANAYYPPSFQQRDYRNNSSI